MQLSVQTFSTPLGDMQAGASDQGICLLLFTDQPAFDVLRSRVEQALGAVAAPGTSPHLDRLKDQLDAYFSGNRAAFDLPLHLVGTPFQEEVWGALCGLPLGETCSYGVLSRKLNKPDAVRAVAKANGENPVLLLVPCHRVVGADGALTGYSGGLHRKQWLLEHERRIAGTAVPTLF